MEILKSFASHILAIIFFGALLFFTMMMCSRELLSRDNLYSTLQKSEIFEEYIKNDERLKKANISEEILDYVDIDDIFYNYLTDDFLYEAKITSDRPTIDRQELNRRLAKGLDAYIDDKVDEYTGGIGSLLDDIGIDLNIKDYVENSKDIDMDEIVKEDDLQKIYETIDEVVAKVRNSTHAFDVISFIYNGKYQMLSVMLLFISLLLIFIINFNILSVFIYSIAPIVINTLIYLIVYLVTSNLKFTGNVTANIINSLLEKMSAITFKYFVILFIILLIVSVLYFVIKHLNIVISHHKGVAILDTVFDDYNSEEVVKEINRRDEENVKKKPKTRKKKTTKKSANSKKKKEQSEEDKNEKA